MGPTPPVRHNLITSGRDSEDTSANQKQALISSRPIKGAGGPAGCCGQTAEDEDGSGVEKRRVQRHNRFDSSINVITEDRIDPNSNWVLRPRIQE